MSIKPRGRFAPSPTGPLHFGSLVTALGSYLNIKQGHGEWLVRIDDLDPPREQPGASDAILQMLEAHGLYWDGEIEYQSRRSSLYLEAIAQLTRHDLIYACRCSRKEIAKMQIPDKSRRYPGTCRNRRLSPLDTSLRIRVDSEPIHFLDAIQGPVMQAIDQEIGDFIIRRRDGLFAYHLAVVIDDADQGISEIARGADLLATTPCQIYLQRNLSLTTPNYYHFPVAVNEFGQKLSKQTRAAPLDPGAAGATLKRALAFLGHQPPVDLGEDVAEILDWASRHWSRERIPKKRHISHSN